MSVDPRCDVTATLPSDEEAVLVGRVHLPDVGPRLVAVEHGTLFDVTALGPTMADLVELDDPTGSVRRARATANEPGLPLARVLTNTAEHVGGARGEQATGPPTEPVLLAPVDLQVLKAAGVTFVRSMLERVIEERVGGDATRAARVRDHLAENLDESIRDVRPGTAEALAVLDVLRENGLWSQYLEVGLGRYPEVFTKGPVLSAVGHGSDAGVSAVSTWNNPEPELVLVVDRTGRARGATLGNDVNLRDIEGASALLLALAKDNNAAAAIGPFIRLFDDSFTLADAATTTISMRIDGLDGFHLEATAPQAEISRPLPDLIAATLNRRHQYPDGLALFCGTPFAPTQDRDAPGSGFTHNDDDVVQIFAPELGTLVNRVVASEVAPRWEYGIRDLIRDLP